MSYTILNSDDPKTVADGAPAYLLLMDSFLVDSQNDPQLLQSGATLYGAYSSIFVSDPVREKKMSSKALKYAATALCLSSKDFCDIRKIKYNEFSSLMDKINTNNIHSWYIFGTTWAGWIKAHSDSMSAIAELPKVTLIMEKVIEINDSFKNGQAHLYLGVLNTLLPPALGGKPETGQLHFKKAIKLTNGKDLTAKVLYAEKYARLIFDQNLHDQLLRDVLKADPYSKNLTLMNILAQQKAQELLASSPDYF
ncbi:MAG: TRAP transporter TatT component family protein [Gammaproteobacteria bacterium]|nr:TRAP transporter TatT component family protein [Gammaproteobacteria bacterium]